MSGRNISLCLIAKNEAEFIVDCLDSVRETVDEMIVVDTGSSDGTADVARQAGACVFAFEWRDDFAAARNASLEAARGDWVLWLDADERLAPGGGSVIREAVASDDFDCGFLFLHNSTTLGAAAADVLSGAARLSAPVLQPRLVRRTPDLQFVGVVHEQLDQWLVPRIRSGRTRTLPAHVVHLGYAPEVRRARAKGERNLRLLQERARQQPADFTTYGYLALEYLELDQSEAAWAAVEQGWKHLSGADPARQQLVLPLACARAQLELARGDAAGALATIELGKTCIGPHPDLDVFEGLALIALAMGAADGATRQSMLGNAAGALEAALQRDQLVYSQGYLGGSRATKAWIALGIVALARDDSVDALRCFEEALTAQTGEPQAWLGKAEALVGLGRAAEALVALDGRLDGSPDGWLVAAMAAEQLGCIDDCRIFFARACTLVQHGYASPHRNERHRALHARIVDGSVSVSGNDGGFP